MDEFVSWTGTAVSLSRDNINTDDIIPARFLKSILRTGYGHALFANWRYASDDSTELPEFPLNDPLASGASVLVAGRNFGCGSSREHAVWALREYGFRSIIAPSFADIFYNNCFNNGILPICLGEQEISMLTTAIDARHSQQRVAMISVNLADQKVEIPFVCFFTFHIDGFRKEMLLRGLDDISWTLSHSTDIATFEDRQAAGSPWLASSTVTPNSAA